MKLAFLTMVWRDYWLLEKWVAHNSKIVPKTQLYVINHGGDPEIDAIAAGCNLIHIPREELTIDLTERRWNLVGSITNGLLSFYDRVVCTDVDELLLYVGTDGDILTYLSNDASDVAALSPIGFNLLSLPTDGKDPQMTVLERHPNAVLSARYTKPCIASKRVAYTVGGHGLIGSRFRIDPNLVLFHLHYVTPDYAERMQARREIVSQSKAHNAQKDEPRELRKRFWANWQNPRRILKKELEIYETAVLIDVSEGLEECAQHLNEAVLQRGKRMIVDPNILNNAGPFKSVVPEAWRSAL